nr:MAG TPA: hypothetical protein [Bacteriophage sp.]
MCIVLENKGQFIEGKSAVRSEGRPSRASVLQALKKFSFPRKTSVFRGFLMPFVAEH